MRAQTLPQTLIHRKQHQHRHRASTIGRMASLKGITSARSSAARPSQRCSRSLSVVQASTAPKEQQPSLATALAGAAAAVLLGAAVAPGSAYASAQKVGEFGASGLLFKDTVELTALDDPEVEGVTLYISDFKRSIVDKLAKDFFSEPSQASLTCEVTGPVSFRQGDPAKLGGTEGSEVFSEQKGLNLFKNKTLRVHRIYDPKRNSLIYIAYSTRLSTAADDGSVSSGRYRTSICALKVPDAPAPAPAAAAAAAAPADAANN